ncbi:MAG: phosphoribosylaminoimidazolesuccinocarboxamide synthase [Deltaproteobacteria bacterium]|nr:phosphoribosylaminoimidazolesuccinocarboxamide synthase [Deltaproteobacteria bacterium]
MEAIVQSNVPGLVLAFRGKVRDVYDLGDRLVIVATDRISAFDVVLPTPIPGKGWVLTSSNFWFEHLKDVVPNHLTGRPLSDVVSDPAALAAIDGRAVLVHKCEPLKVEAIVRGYLAGSGWSEYKKKGTVCGIPLPAGLTESARLPEPIFTPSTKAPAGQHDENITFEQAQEIVGAELTKKVRDVSIELYERAAAWAEPRGILLADTKFEFGLRNGELTLMDEALTPDSSRFWPKDVYQPGRAQPSFDKQFVRDWLNGVGWDHTPPAPELPAEIVTQTAAKYREALDRLAVRG